MSRSLGVETNARVIPGTAGRHWRSAAPDELDDRGWAELRDAQVSTVIDLRNDSELTTSPSHRNGFEVVRAPLEDMGDPEYTSLWNNNWAHPDFYLWGVRHWPQLWDAALTAVADAPAGVLVHCAGGRDRTGLLVAILLDRAGTDRAVVLDDCEAGIRGTNAMLAARGMTGNPADVPANRLEDVVTGLRAALHRVLNEMPAAIQDAGLGNVANRAAAKFSSWR
jgi:hypothetical protein